MKPSFDISSARTNLARATEKHRAILHERFCSATRDFETIVRMIVAKYNPERVWQWGSLMDEQSFTDYSDIDIAIEGVTDAGTFFALAGDAMALSGIPLDIVQMEKIEPEFAGIIRQKGRIVYERP
jgi:predicted nucleotidyltransferase